MRKGFTLIELLVVIAIIAILAAILFPVFGKAREKARQTHCTNNQKQFATAVQIYTQEHDETLPPYETFWGDIRIDRAALKCLTKPSLDNAYVYNLFVASKGLGQIRDPDDPRVILDPDTVFLTADGQHANAATDGLNPNVAYIDGDIAVRHNGKAIVSYLDGHVGMVDQAEADELTADTGTGGGDIPDAVTGVAEDFDATWNATWTVTDPAGGSHTPATIPNGQTAAITFNVPGTYTVTAKQVANPAITMPWTVTVELPDPLPVVGDFTTITNLATFTAGTSATETFFSQQGSNIATAQATGGNPGSFLQFGNWWSQIIIALPAPTGAETWNITFDSRMPTSMSGGPTFKVYGLTDGQTMAYAYGGGTTTGTQLHSTANIGREGAWTAKSFTVNVTAGYDVIMLVWFTDANMVGYGLDNIAVSL